jgi:Uma2 family endonuclease
MNATITETGFDPQAILERWESICADPLLAPLPYKFELREENIIMSPPPAPRHGKMQIKFGALFPQHAPHGECGTEVGVVVKTGVLVADVVWSAAGIDEKNAALKTAPDICIEIWSDSNTPDEFARKRQLYFAAGAKEFWTVDKAGNVAFYVRLTEPAIAGSHRLERSELIPTFPAKLV